MADLHGWPGWAAWLAGMAGMPGLPAGCFGAPCIGGSAPAGGRAGWQPPPHPPRNPRPSELCRTLFSRFLGLARDMLFFSCFGASLIGEAFILAFPFPNLFRRMLGEGTLSSAFIPVFTDTLKKKSEQLALNLLSEVTSRLFLFLGIFTVLVCLLSYFASAGSWFSQEKWEVGLHLNSLSFTYIVLICSSAILVGALN